MSRRGRRAAARRRAAERRQAGAPAMVDWRIVAAAVLLAATFLLARVIRGSGWGARPHGWRSR